MRFEQALEMALHAIFFTILALAGLAFLGFGLASVLGFAPIVLYILGGFLGVWFGVAGIIWAVANRPWARS